MEPMCNGPSEDEPHEVLGSVTHMQFQDSETGDKSSSIQLRTSARVFKKLKLDSQQAAATITTTNTTATSNSLTTVKKDNEDKPIGETKPRGRRAHEVWSPEDKNAFFEALNEYGKDFDAIQQHIGLKARKRGEQVIKNRDQARHFYHRTWHKISKHLRFPEGVKKATQELYGLINFGEFRKKVGFVTEKNCVKLNEMIYFGSTQIRIKGKTSRIKTPICKALRKLNELEECAKEVKLPSRIIVELKPRHNEDWVRVQSLAHNPRVRTELPLNRRLYTLIAYFETRWRLRDDKHRERLIASSAANNAGQPMSSELEKTITDNETSQDKWVFCVAPQPGTQRVEASFKLSAIVTSDKLSLLSHADRQGNDYRYMLQQLQAANKGKSKLGGIKRPRSESSSDKTAMNTSSNSSCTTTVNTSTTTCTSSSSSSNAISLNLSDIVNSIVDSVITVNSSVNTTASAVSSNNCINNSSCSNSSINNEDSALQNDNELFNNSPTLPTSVLSNSFSQSHSLNGNADVNSDKSSDVESDHHHQIEHQLLTLNCDQNDGGAISSVMSSLSPGCSSINNNGEWVSPVKDEFDGESVTASKEKTAEILERVKSGWNSDNSGTTRIGELYVMFGSNSKLLLEYWWERTPNCNDSKISEQNHVDNSLLNSANKALNDNNVTVFNSRPTLSSSVNSQDNVNHSLMTKDNTSNSESDNNVAFTLKRLVSIAKLSFRKVKVQCPCGHVCDSDKSIIASKLITRRVPSKLNRPSDVVSDKSSGNAVNIVHTINSPDGGSPSSSTPKAGQLTDITVAATHGPPPMTITTVIASANVNNSAAADVSFVSKPVADAVFKRPLIAPSQPKTDNSEAFKAQLDKFRLSRYCNRRGRTTKNVVVSRMLPLLPKMPPKVVVIGSPGGYKPIAPAPHPPTTSNTQMTGLISGNSMHHYLQKSKVTVDNNNISNNNNNNNNVMISSDGLSTVPVLFSTAPITTAAGTTNTSFVDIKKGKLDRISLPSSVVALNENSDKRTDESATENISNRTTLEYSIINNNFEELTSRRLPDLNSPCSSSIMTCDTLTDEKRTSSYSDSNITNNGTQKIFDGLLSGNDITLLQSGSSSDNSNAADNIHNIDLQSNPPSPTRILKEDSILINSDDYSLSSLLGHLESPVKDECKNNTTLSDDTSLPDLHSLMCEDSMEFMGKFADLAAHINAEANENK